ncbi:hypothetical protein ABZ883_01505 [Streptomyces sp. NPDC046977]|uniref:hypothetical protein n=1 Tax=Streptomyces sp. NPDC046977 TaxID=3154703 RepID=UPI0033CCE7DA
MFLNLSVYAWVVIAVVVTAFHVVMMRWSMPTPRAKKSVSFIPVAAVPVVLIRAIFASAPLSVTLYLYSATMLIFVIVIAPVRKRVAADILKQEQNPGVKVKADTLSLVWITFSLVVSVVVVAAVWVSQA